MKNAFKAKPLRTSALIFGALALAHTAMYAFTGLHFHASTAGDEGRGVLLFILHSGAIAAGVFSVLTWHE